MLYSLEIRSKAALETLDASDYYDDISVELGDRFENELLAVYKKISVNPLLHKYLLRRAKYRCAKLPSFPYIVVYRVHKDTVVVISVFNTHRKPRYK